jgi:hypothetical protein
MKESTQVRGERSSAAFEPRVRGSTIAVHEYIVGASGTLKHGESEAVLIDESGLSQSVERMLQT